MVVYVVIMFFPKHVVKLPFCDTLYYYTQPQVYAMAKKMPYRSGHMNQMISCAALFWLRNGWVSFDRTKQYNYKIILTWEAWIFKIQKIKWINQGTLGGAHMKWGLYQYCSSEGYKPYSLFLDGFYYTFMFFRWLVIIDTN